MNSQLSLIYKEKILRYSHVLPFSVLVFIIALLPSGQIGEYNIKYIIALLCILSFFILFLSGKLYPEQLRVIIYGFLLSVFLGIWVLIGYINNYTLAINQYQGFLVTIMISMLIIGLFKNNINSLQIILYSMVFGNAMYSIIKITITLLIYLKYISFDHFINIMDLSGVKPVTLELIPGLIRIQTICDIFSPFAIYMILIKGSKKTKIDILVIIIALVSIFLSYSRAIWALTAFVIIISFIRDRISSKSVISIIFTIISSFIIFLSANDIVSNRFQEGTTKMSDQTRSLQTDALLKLFSESPIIGKGMGAYVPDVIRDIDAPFTYEVQWLAFLMQLGIIGITLIVTPILAGLIYIFHTKNRLDWSFLYIIWILLSFTNPYITSSISSLIFASCILAPNIRKESR
jgi:O-Antigen ligase